MNPQQLVEENMNLVYFIIRKYYPGLINDEDIVQIGMLGLCRAANTWDESISKFSNYAGCCIGYAINNELKARNRQIKSLSIEYPITDKNGETDTLADFIKGDNDVDYVNLQPFYDKLKPRQQEVFALLHKGLTVKEIANHFGVSTQTIYSYMRKLRTLWRKHYGD